METFSESAAKKMIINEMRFVMYAASNVDKAKSILRKTYHFLKDAHKKAIDYNGDSHQAYIFDKIVGRGKDWADQEVGIGGFSVLLDKIAWNTYCSQVQMRDEENRAKQLFENAPDEKMIKYGFFIPKKANWVYIEDMLSARIYLLRHTKSLNSCRCTSNTKSWKRSTLKVPFPFRAGRSACTSAGNGISFPPWLND